MFGEYAQIATYLPSSRDSVGAGDFPANSLPSHLFPPHSAWHPSWTWDGFSKRGREQELSADRSVPEDFVMVAEFSEIEGPKPVLTIPKDAGTSIDQNALSVKIMAVDHQTNNEGFSISEDTQVVLSDDDSGVSAFVHHFVLYDNQARGFVRPYCMVFVTADVRKIMMFYEELSSQFKRAARFLKYGNRLLFVKDLERHLQNLEHTKGYLLNQVSRMRLRDSESPDNKTRSNAENELYKGLQNIHQSTTEIRDILCIMKPLLHDRRLESRFRMLEERAYHCGSEDLAHAEKLSLQEDWFSDRIYAENSNNGSAGGSLKESFVSPVSLFKTASSHTPLLVETKKAKRFNSPLRGLHELCSWGAKEGLRKLRCIHEYFKKSAMDLEIEKNESRLMEPSNSMLLHGICVTSNMLSGISMRGSSLCLSEDSSSMLLHADRLTRWPSIASDDTLESFKSVDSYLSLQDEENASLYSFASNNSSAAITTSASGQDFVSAPTSPLTEEVTFPPQSTSHATLPSCNIPPQASCTAQVSPCDTCTVQVLPADIMEPSINALESSTSPSTTSTDTLICRSGVHSVGSAETTETEANNKPSEINTKKHHLETASVPGNITFAACLSNYSSSLKDNSPDEKCNRLGVLTNQQQDGLSGACISHSSDISKENNESGTSEVRENLHQKAVIGTEASEACQKSGFSSDLGSGVCMTNGAASLIGLSETVMNRVPSFVPLSTFNSGQYNHIESQRKHSVDNSNYSSSPEKSVELEGSPQSPERWRLDGMKSLRNPPGILNPMDDACNVDDVGHLIPASAPVLDTCLWKPRKGIYTIGDVINSLGPGRPGHKIQEVLMTYHNLQAVLFSLMTGRTVLVVGPAKLEMEVTKIVTALSIFLPDAKRRQHNVVDWLNRPLKMTDLTRIRLAGVCRSEKRSLDATIPIAIKQYSTVMDIERRMITGPIYHGTFLNSVLHQKKPFKTDTQHVAFIHSWLMEISSKAFILYHSFCLGEAGGLTQTISSRNMQTMVKWVGKRRECNVYQADEPPRQLRNSSHSVEKHKEQYNATVCSLMNRLGVHDDDITIVEHLAEKVKLAQLETQLWSGVDKGSIVHPLIVSSRGNHTVRC